MSSNSSSQPRPIGRPIVGLAGLIQRDGTYLLIQRQGSHGHGTWSIPGGKLDAGESWEEGIRREIREEVGIEVANVRFLAATNDFCEGKHYVSIWLTCDWAGGEPQILEPEKIAALEWRALADLPKPLFQPFWDNIRKVKPELFEARAPLPGRLGAGNSEKPDIHRLITLQHMLLDFRAIERVMPIPPSLDVMENDMEHCYALAMTAWFLAAYFPTLDRDRLIRIALAHDLVEIHSGDTFVYHNEAGVDSKSEREDEALARLEADWPDWPEIIAHLREYQTRSSEEAKFVYALDKLMPSMLDYINEGRGWRHLGITFEDFVREKEKKIPISPDIYGYYRQLFEIVSASPELFAAARPAPAKPAKH